MGGLEQSLGGRLTVDGVDHHLLRSDGLDGFKPGVDVCVACVINGFALTFTAHEHRLDDHVTMEGLEAVDDLIDIVGAVRVIYLINISGIDGVEFQDVVIHLHERVVYLWTVDHRGIAEYGDLRLRTVLVAQTDGVGDDLCEVGMTGGFAVACKGEDIGQLTVGHHLLEFGFQFLRHLLTGGERERRTVVFIETTLAIDAVERADLTVGWQQVDAQRDAETAAVDRAEDRRWIDNCTHNGCKGTPFSRQKNKRNKKISVIMYLCLKKIVILQPNSKFTYVRFMKRRRNNAGNRRGVQMVTLCISTTMVLVLLGMVVFSVLTSHNLSQWVKENLTVTVMLKDEVTVNEAKLLCRDLYHRPYSRNIDYISREQALKEQSEAMGSDPSEFLGMNPFSATLELQMKSDYANRDSLKWIAAELKKNPKVADVAYQVDLMDSVNRNLTKMNLLLLVIAGLLTFVSFALISNFVRLSVYSRRFLIHTMKLVGASWGFIRRPFMKQGLVVGIIAAVLAIVVLGACVYGLYYYEPNMMVVITWRELVITAVAVLLFGIIITSVSAYISVNKFLRMTPGELYKI